MQTAYCFPSFKDIPTKNLGFIEIPRETGSVCWSVIILITTVVSFGRIKYIICLPVSLQRKYVFTSRVQQCSRRIKGNSKVK